MQLTIDALGKRHRRGELRLLLGFWVLDAVRSCGVHSSRATLVIAGSPVPRQFIDAVGPYVAVCGHPHESQGAELLGDAVLVNCGLLEGPADPSLPADPRLAGEDAELAAAYSCWEVHLEPQQVQLFLHRFCPTTHTALPSLVWLYDGRRPLREAEPVEMPADVWPDVPVARARCLVGAAAGAYRTGLGKRPFVATVVEQELGAFARKTYIPSGPAPTGTRTLTALA